MRLFNWLSFLVFMVFLSSCRESQKGSSNAGVMGQGMPINPSTSRQKISALKDSIKILSTNDFRKVHEKSKSKESYDTWLRKYQNTTRIAYIEALTTHYRRFPKDPLSADCLWETHKTFAMSGNLRSALAYGDTLIQQYPKYENRKKLLFDQALLCDQLDDPRDAPRLKKYLNLLLMEASLEPALRNQVNDWLTNAEVPLSSRVK